MNAVEHTNEGMDKMLISAAELAQVKADVTAVEVIEERYRRANETDHDYLSRMAVRDKVRQTAWMAQWTVSTLDGHHTTEATELS